VYIDAGETIIANVNDCFENGIGRANAAHIAAANPATFLALIARLRAAEAALREIADQHIGDCPAPLGHLTDEEWTRRCHGHLRQIARAAYRALTEEPSDGAV
jgi:hypothetical protein